MSRLHLLIGAAIVGIILMVFFGKNPMDEMRKRREMKKAKTLVEKIVQNANKKDMKKSLTNKQPTPNGLKYGMDTSSDIQPMEQLPNGKKLPGGLVTARKTGQFQPGQTQPGESTPIPPPAINGTTLYNPYLQGKTAAPGASNAAPPGAENAAPPAADGYYPPPALKRGNRGKPSSSIQQEELFDPGYGVHMSMPVKSANYDAEHPRKPGNYDMKKIYVAFQGTRAFTKDEQGNPIPLPDGYYSMPGTDYKVLIQGGEKTISN
ncbi:MAG: hypothetical protein K2Q01_00955 [Rickettsiales bacterium]|nr:hypothetical protein [Rickettsiales bacterium]